MGDTLLGEKGSVQMESVEEAKRKSKGKESRFGKRYGFEVKLRCVKLRLEEGLPVLLLCKEVGVSKETLGRWVRDYQERGEAGLRKQVGSSGGRRLAHRQMPHFAEWAKFMKHGLDREIVRHSTTNFHPPDAEWR